MGRHTAEEPPINRAWGRSWTPLPPPRLTSSLPLAAPLPSPPGGSCPPRPPAFLGAETVGAAAWRLPVSLATGPPSSRGACTASRERGSWEWGRAAAPGVLSPHVGGPTGCRGNEKGCGWERKAVMAAGLEEAR